MTFTQKIDWRQLFLVAAIFLMGAVLLAGATPLHPAVAQMFGWLSIAFGVLAAWEVAATRYEFTINALVIHSGGTRQRIRYETIEAVRVAKGVISRIASPNALNLLVGGRSTSGVVSLCPNDRDRFLDELTRAVPWLSVIDR